MKPEILDNFLDREDLLTIQDTLFGSNFPWYFQQGVSYRHSLENDYLYNFQFTHMFWDSTDTRAYSSFFYVIEPLINKMNINALLRVKANLIPVTNERVVHQMHVDNDLKSKTAIFYVNSNNGSTIFEYGEEINSVENRLTIFNSELRHTSSSCTDKKVRCVININYF